MMRHLDVVALFVVALVAAALLASSRVQAQEQREDPKPQASSGEQATRPQPQEVASAPVYKPPLRGAPGGRIGGGTRAGQAVSLSVLAPDHTGLTAQAQPSLYWVISSRSPAPVEVTLVDPRASKPLLELQLKPVDAGVHAIRLAEHHVRLELGVAYRWYVALVPDAARRSRDVLAGGAIERVETPELVRSRLTSTSDAERPALLAQAGLWYDALAAVCQLIEQSPADATLRRHRAAMLEQVGLTGAFDESADREARRGAEAALPAPERR